MLRMKTPKDSDLGHVLSFDTTAAKAALKAKDAKVVENAIKNPQMFSGAGGNLSTRSGHAIKE